MPYIKYKERVRMKCGQEPRDAGELAYGINELCLRYLGRVGKRFSTFATIIGVLVLAVLEFWRRMIAPYEDKKCDEAGDVFPRDTGEARTPKDKETWGGWYPSGEKEGIEYLKEFVNEKIRE